MTAMTQRQTNCALLSKRTDSPRDQKSTSHSNNNNNNNNNYEIMAAAQAAFTNYLNDPLGFDAELRQNIVDQGVDTMEELERMPLEDLDDMFAKI